MSARLGATLQVNAMYSRAHLCNPLLCLCGCAPWCRLLQCTAVHIYAVLYMSARLCTMLQVHAVYIRAHLYNPLYVCTVVHRATGLCSAFPCTSIQSSICLRGCPSRCRSMLCIPVHIHAILYISAPLCTTVQVRAVHARAHLPHPAERLR